MHVKMALITPTDFRCKKARNLKCVQMRNGKHKGNGVTGRKLAITLVYLPIVSPCSRCNSCNRIPAVVQKTSCG